MGYISSMRGFSKRQPTVVSNILGWVLEGRRSGFGMDHGARLMDSTPLPIKMSPSSAMMERAARLTASRAEAQLRLMVTPGTSTGKPASSTAMRATSRLSSPAWLPHPAKASSMRAGSRPLRSMRAL